MTAAELHATNMNDPVRNVAGDASSWIRFLDLQPTVAAAQDRYLPLAFRAADTLVDLIKEHPMLDGHPLMSLLLEQVLGVRETLNCFVSASLHEVAVDSLQRRAQRVQTIVQQYASQIPAALSGPLVVKKSGKEKDFRSVFNTLEVGRSGKANHDLQKVVEVHSLHMGNTSNFTVEFEGEPPLELRAHNDTTKQRWMSLFRMHCQQNYMRKLVELYSPSQAARLYRSVVFNPYSQASKEANTCDFLFASTKTKEVEVALASRGAEDAKPDEKDEKEDEGHQSAFGLRERFAVTTPSGLLVGAKDCEIELNLGTPPLFSIYELVKGTLSDTPSVVYTNTDFVDFKLDMKKAEVEFCFNAKKTGKAEEKADEDMTGAVKGHKTTSRRFVFENAAKLEQCLEHLRVFRQPPANLTFRLLYQDLFNAIDRTRPKTADDDEELHPLEASGEEDQSDPASAGMFRGLLHGLFTSMMHLAPSNGLITELHEQSAKLPLGGVGDQERIKNIALALRGFGIERKEDKDLCVCRASGRCVLLLKRCFATAQGVNDMARFVRMSKDPTTKAWALRTIWTALKAPTATCDTALQTAHTTGTWHTPVLPFASYVHLLHDVEDVQVSAVDVLFEVLLDHELVLSADGHILPVSCLNKKIRNFHLAPVVMYALAHSTTQATKVGLEHMSLLLATTENSETLMACPGWQLWFFPILAQHLSTENQSEDSKACFKLALLLITQLHYQVLFIDRATATLKDASGGHVLFSTLRKLKRFRGWTEESVRVARQIVDALLSMLCSLARTFSNSFDVGSGAYPLVLELCTSVNEFIFFMPLAPTVDTVNSASYGAVDDEKKLTPLMLAAKKGNLTMVQNLVETLGAAIEVTDTQGNTAWHHAILNGHTAVGVYLHQQMSARQEKQQREELLVGLHLGPYPERAVLDLVLLQKTVQLLEALKLGVDRESNLVEFGNKASPTVKKLLAAAKLWYDWLVELTADLKELDAKPVPARSDLLEQLSKKLLKQQQWVKSGRGAKECQLVAEEEGPGGFRATVSSRERVKSRFQRL